MLEIGPNQVKEKWDFVEIEIKVDPQGRPERLVELAQASAPAGWRMVRKPHAALFDLYLDTRTLSMTGMGNYLRVRFNQRSFRRRGRYRLLFKERGEVHPEGLWLARREVRTDLMRDELLRFSEGRMPGLAASLAYETIERANGSPPLVPVCVISTLRRYFSMRSPDPAQSDYLVLSIEQSTAFSAHDIDIDLLLESGFIDGPDCFKTYSFELAEAELEVEGIEEADTMFRALTAAIAEEFEITTTPKYDRCLEELGLDATNVI